MNVTVKVGLFSPCFQFLCVAVEGDMTKKNKNPKTKTPTPSRELEFSSGLSVYERFYSKLTRPTM